MYIVWYRISNVSVRGLTTRCKNTRYLLIFFLFIFYEILIYVMRMRVMRVLPENCDSIACVYALESERMKTSTRGVNTRELFAFNNNHLR